MSSRIRRIKAQQINAVNNYLCRVSDPHHCNADPDPAFHFNANTNTAPHQGWCESVAGLQAGLRIRIHFIRIRFQLQHFRLNTDPDLDPIRIRIQYGSGSRALRTKNRKKITAGKKIKFFFWIKNYNLPIPSLHKESPSYRRSLQLSKEAIQHFKT
jgi:hypothetical protein